MLQSLDRLRFAGIQKIIRGRFPLAGCQVVLIVFILATRAQAQQTIGYVLEVEGAWTVTVGSKSQPLSRRERVPAGGVIGNPSPLDYDRIIISDLTGEPLKRIECKSGSCKECRKSGACYDPIQPLPAAAANPNVSAVIFDAMMKLIVGEPDRYSVHRVRSVGLPNGVAQLTSGQLDLSSIVGKQEKGRYYLLFKSLGSEAGSAGSREPIVFEWDPVRPLPVSVGKLQPGLYELVLRERDPKYTATDISTWVLVSSPDDYAKASASFQQASSLAQKWKEQELSPEVISEYLRAYLDYLAKQSGK